MSEIETRTSLELSSAEQAVDFLDQLRSGVISRYYDLRSVGPYINHPEVRSRVIDLIDIQWPNLGIDFKINLIEFFASLDVSVFRKDIDNLLCEKVLTEEVPVVRAACLDALELANPSLNVRRTISRALKNADVLVRQTAIRTYLYQIKNDPSDSEAILYDLRNLDKAVLVDLIECSSEEAELLSTCLVVLSYIDLDAFYFLAIKQMSSPDLERQLTGLRILGQSQTHRGLEFIRSLVRIPGRPPEIYALAATFLGDDFLGL